eukprot:gnl/MRDRNA2_/MRDRNA2_29437_c0_seq1.p1 gnl/MRDRNA2_/MRDRNA2_29437_c0~~gnl/MRDRNA2_/MRDRNA2_29437_c0_seq1.p1  ORF type:complete len:774 (+),score=199.94 gnl/MRDRNA2_/MRDRNA2_29437_c0_seq1:109-2430(+)
MVCATLPVTLSPNDASMMHVHSSADSGPSTLTLEVTITSEVRQAILARLQDGLRSHAWKSKVQDIIFSAPLDGTWKMSKTDSEGFSLSVQLPAQLIPEKCEKQSSLDEIDELENDPDLQPLVQRIAKLERQLAEKGVEPQTPEKHVEGVQKSQEMKTQVVKGSNGSQSPVATCAVSNGNVQTINTSAGVFQFYKSQTEQQRQQQLQMEIHLQQQQSLRNGSSGIHSCYTPAKDDCLTPEERRDKDRDAAEDAPPPNIFKFFANQVNSENMRERAQKNKEFQDQVQQQFNSLSNIATRFFGKKNDTSDLEESQREQGQQETNQTQRLSSCADISGEEVDGPPHQAGLDISKEHKEAQKQERTQQKNSIVEPNGTLGYPATKMEEKKEKKDDGCDTKIEHLKPEQLRQGECSMEEQKKVEKLKQDESKQQVTPHGGISAFYAKKQTLPEDTDEQPSQQMNLLNVSSVLSFFGAKSSKGSDDGGAAPPPCPAGSTASTDPAASSGSNLGSTNSSAAAAHTTELTTNVDSKNNDISGKTGIQERREQREKEEELRKEELRKELSKEVDERMDDQLHRKQLALDEDLSANQPLFKSIESKDIARSVAIVEDPDFAEINAVDSSGKTALHLAIIYGLGEVAGKIMSRSDFTQINHSDCDGWTPLHCAAGWDRSAMIKGILERPDFTEISARDRWRRTALDVAAAQGNARACAALCGHPVFANEPDPSEKQANPTPPDPQEGGNAVSMSRLRNCTPPAWASCGSRTLPPASSVDPQPPSR